MHVSLPFHEQIWLAETGEEPAQQDGSAPHAWRSLPHHLQADELWAKIRNEARRDAVRQAFAHAFKLADRTWIPSMSTDMVRLRLVTPDLQRCMTAQEQEPALASFLHSSILAHSSFARSMTVFLANKLSSQTLPGTQLIRLITEALEDDPVSPCLH